MSFVSPFRRREEAEARRKEEIEMKNKEVAVKMKVGARREKERISAKNNLVEYTLGVIETMKGKEKISESDRCAMYNIPRYPSRCASGFERIADPHYEHHLLFEMNSGKAG